ncbi:hypothetical protein FB99_37670 [Pantoea agglomerans]|nr:hypothetical protein FB99_37670 [Pantoea agglomerans]
MSWPTGLLLSSFFMLFMSFTWMLIIAVEGGKATGNARK